MNSFGRCAFGRSILAFKFTLFHLVFHLTIINSICHMSPWYMHIPCSSRISSFFYPLALRGRREKLFYLQSEPREPVCFGTVSFSSILGASAKAGSMCEGIVVIPASPRAEKRLGVWELPSQQDAFPCPAWDRRWETWGPVQAAGRGWLTTAEG